jgi:hypothetical protein
MTAAWFAEDRRRAWKGIAHGGRTEPLSCDAPTVEVAAAE